MKRVAESLRLHRAFTLIELLIVIAIILIILAIAMPKVDQALMNGRETAAIKHVQVLNAAQVQYYSQFGKYASTLQELGPPASGQPSASAADLLPKDLAEGTKGGFTFIMQGTPGGYSVNANPVAYNGTGRRSFYSDQSTVIRENRGPEPATSASDPIK